MKPRAGLAFRPLSRAVAASAQPSRQAAQSGHRIVTNRWPPGELQGSTSRPGKHAALRIAAAGVETFGKPGWQHSGTTAQFDSVAGQCMGTLIECLWHDQGITSAFQHSLDGLVVLRSAVESGLGPWTGASPRRRKIGAGTQDTRRYRKARVARRHSCCAPIRKRGRTAAQANVARPSSGGLPCVDKDLNNVLNR